MTPFLRAATAALAAGLIFACATPAASAQEIKPFVSGSMEQILSARHGKPFILGLWSLTCAPCREELGLLGELARKYPALDLVLVSTDSPEEGETLKAALRRYELTGAEAWVFADDFAERLRFEVDQKWRGELPRSYVYDAGHNATAHSGKLEADQVEGWVRKQLGLR